MKVVGCGKGLGGGGGGVYLDDFCAESASEKRRLV